MRHANPLKAGLFIVTSFAVAAGIFFGITGTSALSEDSKDYRVVFDLDEDVNGLSVGSDVRIGGFIVGSVRGVEVADVDSDRPTIRVLFRAPAKYPIRQDATVVVQAGVTGLVNLNITNLGTKGAALADASHPLDGAPSGLALALTSFAGIGGEVTQTLQQWRPKGIDALDQIRTTAASADQTIQQVRGKIDPAYDKYVGVADSTKGATDAAKGAMATLDEILGGGKGDIRETFANLRGVTATANDRLPKLVDELSQTVASARGAIDKSGKAIEDAQAIAADGREIAAGVRGLVNGNRARLDDIVRSLNLTGSNLAAASGEIRRSPWRLLYKPSEGEVANQNLYDATRQFAEASRKLQDSSQALKDTLGDGKSTPADVQSILEKLNADFENYKKVERTLWDRVR
jgi:ABC-type transporter Mla subunit MlaD